MKIISFIVDQKVDHTLHVNAECGIFVYFRLNVILPQFQSKLQIVMENVLKNQFSSAVFHMILTG